MNVVEYLKEAKYATINKLNSATVVEKSRLLSPIPILSGYLDTLEEYSGFEYMLYVIGSLGSLPKTVMLNNERYHIGYVIELFDLLIYLCEHKSKNWFYEYALNKGVLIEYTDGLYMRGENYNPYLYTSYFYRRLKNEGRIS